MARILNVYSYMKDQSAVRHRSWRCIVWLLAATMLVSAQAQFPPWEIYRNLYGDWTLGDVETNSMPKPLIRVGEDPDVKPSSGQKLVQIELRVVDNVTGKPVEDAQINVTIPGDEVMLTNLPIVAQTDARGGYRVRRLKQLPVPGQGPSQFNSPEGFHLNVSHSNYCSAAVNWMSYPGQPHVAVPAQFEIRLVRGVPITLAVVGADGQPSVEASVVPEPFPEQTPQGVQQNIWRTDPLNPDSQALTDHNGIWRMSGCPPENLPAAFSVRDRDGVSASFRARDYPEGYGNAPDRFIRISPEALTNGTVRLEIPKGIAVKGIVMGPDGKPLEGATVFEWFGVAPLRRGGRAVTGSGGRFEFLHRQAKEILLGVMAPQTGATSMVAVVKQDMPEIRVTLPPKKPLKLRVVDGEGKPIVGVRVRTDPMTQVSHQDGGVLSPLAMPFVWAQTTGSDGRVEWQNAPPGRARYAFLENRGGFTIKNITPTGSEVLVRVGGPAARSTSVRIRVTDLATGKPLENPEVFSKTETHMPWAKKYVTNVSEFSLVLGQGIPVESFQIRVPGYAHSKAVDTESADEVIQIAMERVESLRFQVLDPEGQAAQDARAWVSSAAGQNVYLQKWKKQKLEVNGWQVAKINADGEGRLVIDAGGPESRAAIIGKDGYWAGRLSDLRGKTQLKLLPFGKVSGRILANGKPMPGVRLGLNLGDLSGESFLHGGFSTESDAKGDFDFEDIPAGTHILQRITEKQMVGQIYYSHTKEVKVDSGAAVTVEYTFGGRSLAGVLQCDGDEPDDWTNCKVVATPIEPQNTVTADRYLNDFVSFVSFNAAGGYGSTHARSRSFRGSVEPDGSFEILDVPPGQYTFSAHIHKEGPAKRNQWEPIPEIGSSTQALKVTAGAEALDMGTVVVKTSASPATGDGKMLVGSMKVLSLDGKEGGLPMKPGRALLMVFWATWSEKSISELQAMWDLASGKEVDLVAVNVDAEPKEVSTLVVEKKLPGKHVAWGQKLRSAQLDLTKEDVVPSVWAFDGKGRVSKGLSRRGIEVFLKKAGTP